MTRTRGVTTALGAMAALIAVIARNRIASTKTRYTRTRGSGPPGHGPTSTTALGRRGRLKTVGSDSL